MGEQNTGSTHTSPMSAMTREVLSQSPAAKLDQKDLRLLTLLARDSRVSQRQLANEMGMSPPAVGERLARLEREGVIRGYTLSVDWAALGYPGLVYLSLAFAAGAKVADIVHRLRNIPELVELGVVTGNYDLIARFRIRDHAHLQGLLLDQVWPIPGIERIETFLGLGEVIQDRIERTIPALLEQGDSSS